MNEFAVSAGRAAGRCLPLLGAVLGAVFFLGTPSSPSTAADDPVAEVFSRFEKAWQTRNAAELVACMEPKGRLRIRLFERPFEEDETYDMLADRAEQSLVAYFERVVKPKLAESKPPEDQPKPASKDARETSAVRTYDYRYRVKGRGDTVTRLQVRVVRGEGKQWTLESVLELRRP